MRLLHRTLLMGALAVALVGTSEATAAVTTSTKGAHLKWEPSRNTFILTDTDCDSHPVYAEYRIGEGPIKRVDWHGGCNTSTSFVVAYGPGQIGFKACVNVQLRPDRCSDAEYSPF
jgi:hypothetical protein